MELPLAQKLVLSVDLLESALELLSEESLEVLLVLALVKQLKEASLQSKSIGYKIELPNSRKSFWIMSLTRQDI